MTTAPDAPSGPQAPPSLQAQARMIEAMLFAAATPLSLRDLALRLPAGCDPAMALEVLAAQYHGRGVVLERVGEGHAFRTAPDLSFLMQAETVDMRRLSRAAIETLAIIAYHQPVTRTEIEEIRGVALSRGTLDQLIEMDWVRVGRRRMTPGRPATYVVTDSFLDHFGLESARDLPGLAELRAAGLLDSRPPVEGLGLPLAPTGEDDDIESMAADGAAPDDDEEFA